jgi:hypothetical protein
MAPQADGCRLGGRAAREVKNDVIDEIFARIFAATGEEGRG